jgi:hypothetical protein
MCGLQESGNADVEQWNFLCFQTIQEDRLWQLSDQLQLQLLTGDSNQPKDQHHHLQTCHCQ